MAENNDKRNMLRDAAILFAITLISGLLLGLVYQVTVEPRREQQERKIREACQTVFADAEQFEEYACVVSSELAQQLAEDGVKLGTVFRAMDALGNPLGYVIEMTSSEGYGGNITLYAGITNDGILNGVSILNMNETPGLGMRAHEVLVPQFEQKTAADFTYTKTGSQSEHEIDAISGATITTKAVTNAVNGAVRVFAQNLQKGGEGNE
ncbi:MAG: RnfABCDGE type electron transport complex subunit G [bacterium]|nr:RnfABCDGE type electron transport complex subunit G [bacterium]MCM1376026.1 RnfABCDGE type electron transport complex subunit G [Muribaculum sp.]